MNSPELLETALANGHATETSDGLTYMSGFGNEFATEALPGALPVGRNSPQRPPYGLYAEQISGTPFTASRKSPAFTFTPIPVSGERYFESQLWPRRMRSMR